MDAKDINGMDGERIFEFGVESLDDVFGGSGVEEEVVGGAVELVCGLNSDAVVEDYWGYRGDPRRSLRWCRCESIR